MRGAHTGGAGGNLPIRPEETPSGNCFGVEAQDRFPFSWLHTGRTVDHHMERSRCPFPDEFVRSSPTSSAGSDEDGDDEDDDDDGFAEEHTARGSGLPNITSITSKVTPACCRVAETPVPPPPSISWADSLPVLSVSNDQSCSLSSLRLLNVVGGGGVYVRCRQGWPRRGVSCLCKGRGDRRKVARDG